MAFSPQRRLGLKTVLALSALPLLACQGREPLLRIGAHDWPGYAPLFLARELGYMNPSQVRLHELTSATNALQALSAGAIDAAGLTLDEVLTARAEGLTLTAALIFDFSAGADVLLAHPALASLADLRGRRIGAESSAVGAVMLDAALTAAGLDPSAVQVVPLTVDRHEAAFLTGEVDAVVTFEPVAHHLERRGARRLFDSSSIPGRIVDVLAVRPTAISASPMALRGLLKAYFHSLDYLAAHPRDATRIMGAQLALEPEATLTALAGLQQPDLALNQRWLRGAEAELPRRASELAALMVARRLLPGPVSLAGIGNGNFLPGEPRP